ncbi:hypothetical protein BDR26DRAFT_872756 [Obelidium mucronatum]|nr:hypothetical protein BDR26DRAFT_872756 [Obelidium mucronatum]
MEMSYTAYSWVRAKDIFKLHVTLSTYRNVQKLIYVLPFICMAIIACTFIDLTSNVLKQYLFLLLVCLAGIIALTLDLFFALGYIRQLLQNQDNNVHIPLHYSIISRYGLLTTLLSFLSLVFCIIQFLVHSRLVQSTVSSPPPDILIEAYTLTVILQDLFVFLSFFTLLMMRVALLRPSVHGVFGRRTSSSLAKNYLQSGSNDTRGVGSSGDSVRKGSGAIQQNFLSSVSVFMTQQQQQQQQQSFSRTNLGIFRTPSLSMGAGGATVSKGLKSRASSMSFPKS